MIGIFQSTPEGRILSVNPVMAQMFGYDSPEDMIIGVKDLGHQVFVDMKQREQLQHELAETGVLRGQEYHTKLQSIYN